MHLNSPTQSVDIVVARLMQLEPKKDGWWRIAHDWYAQVLTDYPGHGKFYHHLGLLSCGAEGEELRGIYHFVER